MYTSWSSRSTGHQELTGKDEGAGLGTEEARADEEDGVEGDERGAWRVARADAGAGLGRMCTSLCVAAPPVLSGGACAGADASRSMCRCGGNGGRE
jgi:hypothetical protein